MLFLGLGSDLLGGAQPVIPPNLYMFMNIIAWGPQVVSKLV